MKTLNAPGSLCQRPCQQLCHTQASIKLTAQPSFLKLHQPRVGQMLTSRAHRHEMQPGGSGLQTSTTGTRWLVPSKLLPSEYVSGQQGNAVELLSHTDLTVYTVRLATGYSRGAAMSEPYSGVNVCLIGQDGRAILHRISPLNDPAETLQQLEDICQIVGDDAGADCRVAMSGSPSSSIGSRPPPAPAKRRFLEGSVDEVSFVGEDLGPLAGLLVGTEQGSWTLDEADVVSSRTRHIDRFVCRRTLGEKGGEGASLLAPVPAGAVVYGDGEQAVMLSEEQASALHALGMSEYDAFKSRMLAMTGLLVAGGGSLAALTLGADAAVAFVVGGGAGLLYQWLLMSGVDHMVVAANATSARSSSRSSSNASSSIGTSHGSRTLSGPLSLQRVLGSPPARLAFVCVLALVAVSLASQEPTMTGAVPGPLGASSVAGWQLLMGAMGFFTYKVALVSAYVKDGVSGTGSDTDFAARKKFFEKSGRSEES